MNRRMALGGAGCLAAAGAAAVFSHYKSNTEIKQDGVSRTGVIPERFRVAGSRHSDMLPDEMLVNHEGDSVRFYSDLIRDQIVLVSFMYTQCEGICPATVGWMKKLRVSLSEILGRDSLRLICLTLDPETDSSEVLKSYAEQLAGTPGNLPRWDFVTGSFAGITRIRKALGYFEPDPVLDQDKTRHAAFITCGNDRLNQWHTFPVGLTWNQKLGSVLRTVSRDSQFRYRHMAAPDSQANI